MAKVIAIIIFITTVVLATSPSTYNALSTMASHNLKNTQALDY